MNFTFAHIIQQEKEYQKLPEEFIHEVQQAEKNNDVGKLVLLADEASGFTWETAACRLIGELLYNKEYYIKTKEIFEKIQSLNPNDPCIKEQLLTIDQQLTLISKNKNYTHSLLFTGHMIDKAGRKEPRFPAAKEEAVRELIKEKVTKVKNKLSGSIQLKGIAGGACGGDILFHEVCAQLGIPTQILLALPEGQFKIESVSFAGSGWVYRFDKLLLSFPHLVLTNSKALPGWLQRQSNYNIWERNNLWQLHSALINGGANMSLIALWDGKEGDGPGGTQHMIKLAAEKGASVIVIKMNSV